MPTSSAAESGRSSGPSSTAIWAGILVLYLVWGSTYLGIAIAIETIPPFLMAAIRFMLAGTLLLGLTKVLQRGEWSGPSRRQLRDSAIVGALLLGGGMGLVSFGEQSVPSGLAAIFIAMMPLWVAVFGRLLYGQRLPPLAVLGVFVGLVGVVVLAWPGDASLEGVDPLHLAGVIVAPMCWALGALFAANRADLPEHPLVATSLQMITGSLVLFTAAAVTGEIVGFVPADVSTASFAAFLYLTFVGSLVAFTVFAWLLRVAPLPKVATYAYVNPIVAVILGAIVLSEPITGRTIVAGGIVIAAVALIVTARGRASRPAAASEQGSVVDGLDPAAGSASGGTRRAPEVLAEP